MFRRSAETVTLPPDDATRLLTRNLFNHIAAGRKPLMRRKQREEVRGTMGHLYVPLSKGSLLRMPFLIENATTFNWDSERICVLAWGIGSFGQSPLVVGAIHRGEDLKRMDIDPSRPFSVAELMGEFPGAFVGYGDYISFTEEYQGGKRPGVSTLVGDNKSEIIEMQVALPAPIGLLTRTQISEAAVESAKRLHTSVGVILSERKR